MVKRFCAFLGALLLTTQVYADVLTINKDAPQNYVVKEGDTLWDISGIYLSKPWDWPKLWRYNPQIDNPHLIYPGDVISLVYDAQGVPMLVVNQSIKKLSPKTRKTKKKDQAVPTLPLQLIRPYLTYDQAVDPESLNNLPYVLGADDNHKTITTGHIVYIRGDLEVGKQYGIYRVGEPYVDPESEAQLGQEIVLVATVRAFRSGDISNGVPSSATVSSIRREVQSGDILMPASKGQFLPAFFSMRKPESQLDGDIIATSSKLREFSKLDIVVLNLGETDDLKAGHILDIVRTSPHVLDTRSGPKYQEDASNYDRIASSTSALVGREASDGAPREFKMPREKVGTLMVFKVYEQIAYAMVTDTLRPVRVGDHVITP